LHGNLSGERVLRIEPDVMMDFRARENVQTSA
jgi:hypothetical protein